jgi:hypothetical protein
MDSLEVGSVSSFFHLNSYPDIFIRTVKSINGYYFYGFFTVVVFVMAVAGLINTIKNWNNKERWVRN